MAESVIYSIHSGFWGRRRQVQAYAEKRLEEIKSVEGITPERVLSSLKRMENGWERPPVYFNGCKDQANFSDYFIKHVSDEKALSNYKSGTLKHKDSKKFIPTATAFFKQQLDIKNDGHWVPIFLSTYFDSTSVHGLFSLMTGRGGLVLDGKMLMFTAGEKATHIDYDADRDVLIVRNHIKSSAVDLHPAKGKPERLGGEIDASIVYEISKKPNSDDAYDFKLVDVQFRSSPGSPAAYLDNRPLGEWIAAQAEANNCSVLEWLWAQFTAMIADWLRLPEIEETPTVALKA